MNPTENRLVDMDLLDEATTRVLGFNKQPLDQKVAHDLASS